MGQTIKKMFRPETRGKKEKKKEIKLSGATKEKEPLFSGSWPRGLPQSNLRYTLFFVVSLFPFKPFPHSDMPMIIVIPTSHLSQYSTCYIFCYILNCFIIICIGTYQYTQGTGHSTMVMCLLTWKSTYKNLVF